MKIWAKFVLYYIPACFPPTTHTYTNRDFQSLNVNIRVSCTCFIFFYACTGSISRMQITFWKTILEIFRRKESSLHPHPGTGLLLRDQYCQQPMCMVPIYLCKWIHISYLLLKAWRKKSLGKKTFMKLPLYETPPLKISSSGDSQPPTTRKENVLLKNITRELSQMWFCRNKQKRGWGGKYTQPQTRHQRDASVIVSRRSSP